MNYISRNIEGRLEQAIKDNKAVLLTGARQVGKSTLMKKLFPGRSYVTLDDPFLEEQAKESSSEFMMLNPPPLTLDEVQRAPILFRYIKLRCDESEDTGLYLMSGSQQFHLMKEVSESMAGRVRIFELSGLSLREIMGSSFHGHFIPTIDYILARKNTMKRPENIWEIIHRGSYPALQDRKKSWVEFYADYITTYIERDVRELSAVQDLDAFRRFMIACAARSGQILNYTNIADEIGKGADSVKNWMSILESSGIIYLLEPYSSNVLKRAIKTPKLYFRDTGLLCYLTRWLTPEALAYGANAGAVFETFAVSEVLKTFSEEGLDYRHFVSYYRGKDSGKSESEIDLIIEENGVLYPIEIKKSSKPTADMTKSFPVLDRLTNRKRGSGCVLCLCPEPGVLRENVLAIPVWYV